MKEISSSQFPSLRFIKAPSLEDLYYSIKTGVPKVISTPSKKQLINYSDVLISNLVFSIKHRI